MFEENVPNNLPTGNQPEDPFAKIESEKAIFTAPASSPPPPPTSLAGEEIHTMPEKFLTQPLKKVSTTVILIIVLLLVLIAAGVGVFFFRDKISGFLASRFGGNVALEVNSTPSNLNNTALVNETNENTNNTNTNENTNLNENTNNETNTNLNTNTEVTQQFLDTMLSSTDTDNDLLTDAEETIYQTNPNQADSDQDGYLDGQEVVNFYDPAAAQVKLANSTAVHKYTNSDYGYSVYYPATWQARNLGEGNQEVIFDSGVGEFIGISVQENPNGLSALDWYSQSLTDFNSYEIQKVNFGTIQAIKSLDGFSLYFSGTNGGKNYIYTLTYNIGNKTEVAYKTTFQMMQKSFEFIP
ncbi:MAG: thrombospondin type 3 repeat-containing protein [bacterium]